jgi:hypothetical protein
MGEVDVDFNVASYRSTNMVKKHFAAAASLLLVLSCDNPTEPVDILTQLRALPGVTVTEIEPHYDYPRAFRLDITQPVDHDAPNGPQFTQRAYLFHVDDDMPMVFAPSGYGTSPRSGQEIAGVLGTNALNVTHRYFVDAEPDPMDWQYLTVEQSAADHHHIVELFKEVYPGPWVSAGASKGGETVLFHRRFYPDDVDATIAYVAPLVFGTADPRFLGFLESIGGDECRNRIHRFQRTMLAQRDSLLGRFADWFVERDLAMSGDVEAVFESSVRSYDWTFWQYHAYDCSSIPELGVATYDEMLEHMAEVVRLDRASDDSDYYFRPYVYQAFTQIGYPARTYDHLEDLLVYEPGHVGRATFDPLGVELVYDPSVVVDVYRWLQTTGEEIVYIYGDIDPWTGGAVEEPSAMLDVEWILQEGADHRVRIADLDERQAVYSALERWLGVEVSARVVADFLRTLADTGDDLLIQGM